MKVELVVEGHGEVSAIPVLLRRIVDEYMKGQVTLEIPASTEKQDAQS